MRSDVPAVPKETRVPRKHLDAALAACPAQTAAGLAEVLGVDVTTVSRWRRGLRPLSRPHWLAILAVLGLPLDWRPATASALPSAKTRGRGRPRGSTVKR